MGRTPKLWPAVATLRGNRNNDAIDPDFVRRYAANSDRQGELAVKHSTERILTTHVGSLPRPPDLLEMIQAKEQGGGFDTDAFAGRVTSAVAEVVRKQVECGIDIVADGEMGRFGFIPYVNERLSGLEARPNPGRQGTWARSREHLAFPEYYA